MLVIGYPTAPRVQWPYSEKVLSSTIRLHFPSSRPTTLPLWSMMNIACLPGFGKSTRTCHLPSAVVAVKAHGAVESHLPLTWRLADSIAPSLSRAAAHGAQDAKTVAATAAW